MNGTSLIGATHQEAVRALRSVSDQMFVMVCEGFDPTLDLQSPDSPNAPLQPSRGRGDSVSSIDRDGDDLLIIQKVGRVCLFPLTLPGVSVCHHQGSLCVTSRGLCVWISSLCFPPLCDLILLTIYRVIPLCAVV